jgi:delta 1-pyrroline-5-carboxylate dehydrogenase
MVYEVPSFVRWASPQKVKHEEINPICFIGSSEIRHEPKGVMLIIAPWNYPIQLLLGPMVYAIAAGNCIVAKPSEITVNCAKLIEELVHKYLDTSCIRVQARACACARRASEGGRLRAADTSTRRSLACRTAPSQRRLRS